MKQILFSALFLSTSLAAAAPVQTPHVEAELIAEHTTLKAGGDNWLALRLKPEAGWHTYWINPGDSGLPTKIQWTLPAGISAGEIVWPHPHAEKLGELTNYGYDGETLHLVPLTVGTDVRSPVEIKAEAKWLVCADICIPGSAQLSLSLPVSSSHQTDDRWTAAFADARAHIPLPAPDWEAKFSVDPNDVSLSMRGAALAGARQVEFFPANTGLVAHNAPQRIELADGSLRLSQALSPYFTSAPEEISGVLLLDGKAYSFSAQPGVVAAISASAAPLPVTAPDQSLPLVLLFALLGGLILNLMPCVFPVLSLKALSVMHHGGRGAAHNRGHALAYTAGVVASCVGVAALLLGLRAGGEAIGWGFQLQSPVFVAALVYVLFTLGLSLSGAVEFGTGVMGVGQSLTQKSGPAGSFFTGVLATVVASPCTAPFMGSALGYAVTQSAPVALLVFTCLGLGLALPFLLIGFFPALARALPKPGAWMNRFKQAMAFPLYLTAVWLLWVLSHQASADAAALTGIGLVLIAFVLWLWRAESRTARTLKYAALGLALALLAHPLMRAAAAPASQTQSNAWSETRVAELRAQGRTIFVNFTADWCVTCKLNERIALSSGRVQQIFKERNVVWLTGDWTREDPAITAALARFGRNGVPLYLVYAKGGEPEVLPQLLTPDIVIDSLQ